jgi:hypothetical protein
MLKKIHIALVLVFSFLLFTQISKLPFNWGSVPETDELYLTEWGAQGEFVVYSTNSRDCFLCNEKVSLVSGENTLKNEKCEKKVELTCGSFNVSFFPNKETPEPEQLSANFTAFYSEGAISIRINGSGNLMGYRRLDFFLDGEKVHSPAVLLNGEFYFLEKIKAPPGIHKLSVILSEKELYSGDLRVPEKPFSLELWVILISSIGIIFLLFSGEKEITTPVVSFIVLLVFGFVYQFVFSNNFGLPSVLVPIAYLGGLAWAYKKRH